MATIRTASAPAPPRLKGCCIPLAALLADAVVDDLAAVHRALAAPTRVKATAEPICVCDFTAAFDLGQPTVSHHQAKLRDAGFVTSEKQGIWAFYRLRDDMPATARAVLALVP